MRDVYDMMTGLSYVPLTSQKRDEPEEKHSTIGQGLAIVIGFMAMVILALALA